MITSKKRFTFTAIKNAKLAIQDIIDAMTEKGIDTKGISAEDTTYAKAGYTGGMRNAKADNGTITVSYTQNAHHYGARAALITGEQDGDELLKVSGYVSSVKGEGLKDLILKNI